MATWAQSPIGKFIGGILNADLNTKGPPPSRGPLGDLDQIRGALDERFGRPKGEGPKAPPAPAPAPKAESLGMNDLLNMVDTLGGPAKASLAAGTARGEETGTAPDPALANLPTEEKAKLDRFAQGAVAAGQMGLGGEGILPTMGRGLMVPGVAAVGAGNELSKALPGLQGLIAKLTGDQQFQPDQSTSDPSLANILALIQGFGVGGAQAPATPMPGAGLVQTAMAPMVR